MVFTAHESTVIDGGKQRLVIQFTPMEKNCNLLLRKHSWKPLGFADSLENKYFGPRILVRLQSPGPNKWP